MSRWRGITGCALAVALGACGDSGRENDDASGSAGPSTATATMSGGTTAAPTTSASATQGESDAGSASATQGMTTSTTAAPTTSDSASGSTSMPVSTTDPDTTGSTGGTTGDPCGGGMGGVFDFSYLWVANTDQGSISKVNTREAANSGDYAGIRRVA